MMYNMPMRGAKTQRLSSDQRGFAAIVVAMVIVTILSLMTVGFAQLMRSEQESALEKHLSSQAYYAAEAGINDAAKAINAGYTKEKTKCDASDVDASLPGHEFLDSADNQNVGSKGGSLYGGVYYSCLIMNPLPPTLEYSAIDTTEPKVILVSGVDKSNPDLILPISKLEIGWQDSEGGDAYAPTASPTFKPSNEWTYAGILRMNLTPLYTDPVSGGLTRQNLINDNFAAFLYPNGAGAAASPGTFSINDGSGVNGGAIVYGNCNNTHTPRHCNVTITGLKYANYALSLRSIYKKTRVTIKAIGFDGQQLRIKNGQTLVDSTGHAEGVQRRVQVRIPSKNNYSHPGGTEAISGICKQLQLEPAQGSRACTP
jgi:hypothetical protein